MSDKDQETTLPKVDARVGGSVSGSMTVAGGDVIYNYNYVERSAPDVPYLAPSLPPHHVIRPAEMAALVERIRPDGDAVAVTAMRGLGGIGKTTLAIALCHDRTIIERFPDGVLWASLGDAAAEAEASSAQQAWASALAKVDLSANPTLEARAAQLRGMLHGRRCLIVIDDVWRADFLEHLCVGGEGCFTLITTRERKVAQEAGSEHLLGVLTPAEAVAMLQRWADDRDVGTEAEAVELAARLGHLPLALRLAGAQTMDGVRWPDLIAHFHEKQGDLSVLDMDDPTRREESLGIAFDLSLERLSEGLQTRFAALGVFAAGRDAPFDATAAAAVWDATETAAKKALGRLVRARVLSFSN